MFKIEHVDDQKGPPIRGTITDTPEPPLDTTKSPETSMNQPEENMAASQLPALCETQFFFWH